MKPLRLAHFFLLLLLVFGGAVAQDQQQYVAAAKQAAASWLQVNDADNFRESWIRASRILQAAPNSAWWEREMTAQRSYIGKNKTRTLRSASYTTNMPMLPPGEYVKLQFDSNFEKKPGLVEVITVRRESVETWKVCEYYFQNLQ